MMRPRPSSITPMPSMPMTACGITSVDTKFQKAKPTPTRWKGTMPSCATTWRAWQDRRVVSRVVRMHWNVPCACLSTAITDGNSISNGSLPIRLTLRISLTHDFSHSRLWANLPRTPELTCTRLAHKTTSIFGIYRESR